MQHTYLNTNFNFTHRGVKGVDVGVLDGIYPSEYSESRWDKENNFGDFKPNTTLGRASLKKAIKSGQLQKKTQALFYNPKTEKLEY